MEHRAESRPRKYEQDEIETGKTIEKGVVRGNRKVKSEVKVKTNGIREESRHLTI